MKLQGLLGKGKKGIMVSVMPIALGTAGVIASQKFLDFQKIFPKMTPDKFVIKHEGLIKIGAVVITMQVWKKMPDWIKFLMIGIAIQGGIKAARKYTMKDGVTPIDQIGEAEYNEAIQAAAKSIESITQQFKVGVSGNGVQIEKYGTNMRKEDNPAVDLVKYSNTGVAGMGMEDMENFN